MCMQLCLPCGKSIMSQRGKFTDKSFCCLSQMLKQMQLWMSMRQSQATGLCLKKPAAQLSELALSYISLYLNLSEHFANEGVKIFNVTSKAHMMVHSLLLAGHVHPYVVWCFKGEDFMRISSRVLKTSVNGVPPHVASLKGVTKLRAGMHSL